MLAITFSMAGDLSRIVLPEETQSTGRRHELWRRTCFEVFFGKGGHTAYWEGNFAPSGDWNLYRFSAYREAMTEERRVEGLPCRVHGGASRLDMACSLATTSLCRDEDVLAVGIGCVILETNGSISYWAVEHCGDRPDFHDRRSFVLSLAGVVSR